MVGEEYLKEWCKEYSIDFYNLISEYRDLGKSTLGLTTFKREYGISNRIAIISINTRLEKHPFLTTPVLWHEFCHAEVWIKEGKSDGHSDKFTSRMLRKKLLWFLDVLVVPLCWIKIRYE